MGATSQPPLDLGLNRIRRGIRELLVQARPEVGNQYLWRAALRLTGVIVLHAVELFAGTLFDGLVRHPGSIPNPLGRPHPSSIDDISLIVSSATMSAAVSRAAPNYECSVE
jgi:hypothetical protein